jgi:hypothetical protein
MAYSTPATPAVDTVNADTIRVSVGSIDAGATHIDVYAQQTVPNAVAATLINHGLKADNPFTITDLIPGATYLITAKAWSVSDESLFSGATQIVIPRLFIFGHISTSAAGVTGVDVDVGYQPATGRLFPSALIGPAQNNKSFDLSTATYNGSEQARMVIQLFEMPDPKIRNGDLLCMVMRKQLGGFQERWSKIIYDAICREDAPNYIPPSSAGDTDLMFDDNFYDPSYFLDDYFA